MGVKNIFNNCLIKGVKFYNKRKVYNLVHFVYIKKKYSKKINEF